MAVHPGPDPDSPGAWRSGLVGTTERETQSAGSIEAPTGRVELERKQYVRLVDREHGDVVSFNTTDANVFAPLGEARGGCTPDAATPPADAEETATTGPGFGLRTVVAALIALLVGRLFAERRRV
jgi:hypothetical protein